MTEQQDDEWERLWDERLTALESLFGPTEDRVGHALVPLGLGPEAGGAADVVYFKRWKPGQLTVTADLLGMEDQPPNEQGAYELAICHRDDEKWGPNIVSRLANYTLECPLNPGETMDIHSVVPKGSTIAAFLFHDLARFEFRGHPAGVLLCIGITAEELSVCRDGGVGIVLSSLRSSRVFPYTDLRRRSV